MSVLGEKIKDYEAFKAECERKQKIMLGSCCFLFGVFAVILFLEFIK